MKYIFIIFSAILLSACSNINEPANDDSYLCIKVVDGDTYDFSKNCDTFRVRHLYIDCFETSYGSRLDKQAKRANISVDSALHLGLMAKQYITDLILHKSCILARDTNEEDKDIYGRFLRTVTYNNQRLDSLLLIKGLALPY